MRVPQPAMGFGELGMRVVRAQRRLPAAPGRRPPLGQARSWSAPGLRLQIPGVYSGFRDFSLVVGGQGRCSRAGSGLVGAVAAAVRCARIDGEGGNRACWAPSDGWPAGFGKMGA